MHQRIALIFAPTSPRGQRVTNAGGRLSMIDQATLALQRSTRLSHELLIGGVATTARTHLDSKAGISRQSELVRLVSKIGPAVASLGEMAASTRGDPAFRFAEISSRCLCGFKTRLGLRAQPSMRLHDVGANVGTPIAISRKIQSFQRLTDKECWRRGRDSNPRDGFPPTRVPGVRLQPLGHLSGAAYYSVARSERKRRRRRSKGDVAGARGP